MATPEEMEKNAPLAEQDLSDMTEGPTEKLTIVDVANWWKKWLGGVGHKRLGRILIQYAGAKGQ